MSETIRHSLCSRVKVSETIEITPDIMNNCTKNAKCVHNVKLPFYWQKKNKTYGLSSEDPKCFSNNVNHAHQKLYDGHPNHQVIPILFIIQLQKNMRL